MKSHKLLWLIWLGTATFFTILSLQLNSGLPQRVATHFGANGLPNGWMPRDVYLNFTLLFGMGTSLFLMGTFYIIRFIPPQFLNVPHHEYWRSPEHFPEACDYLWRWGMGCAIAELIWFAVINVFIVQANRANPVVLHEMPLMAITGIFLLVIGISVVDLTRFFNKIKP
jgi:hypothetical protein